MLQVKHYCTYLRISLNILEKKFGLKVGGAIYMGVEKKFFASQIAVHSVVLSCCLVKIKQVVCYLECKLCNLPPWETSRRAIVVGWTLSQGMMLS